MNDHTQTHTHTSTHTHHTINICIHTHTCTHTHTLSLSLTPHIQPHAKVNKTDSHTLFKQNATIVSPFPNIRQYLQPTSKTACTFRQLPNGNSVPGFEIKCNVSTTQNVHAFGDICSRYSWYVIQGPCFLAS